MILPYVPRSLRPALNEYTALERRAIDAAEHRYRLHQIKLPPIQWAKRLVRMAVTLSQIGLCSVGECMDHIEFSKTDRDEWELASEHLSFELRYRGWTP